MAVSRINSPFSTGLSESPDTQNPEIFGELQKVYIAIQILQQAITNYTGIIGEPPEYWSEIGVTDTVRPQNQNRFYPISSENIIAGAIVNLHNNAGILNVRNANATNNTKQAHGYAPNAIVSGNRGEIILFNGLCTSIAGMTPGQRYWLNTVNGQIINVPPVAAGNIEQAIGLALSSTLLYFLTDLQFIQH